MLRMRVSGPITPVVKAAAGFDLSDFICREPTLEETFLAVYGPQGNGDAPAQMADARARPAR